MAQPGSARRSGRRGREFKSRYPDKREKGHHPPQADDGLFLF